MTFLMAAGMPGPVTPGALLTGPGLRLCWNRLLRGGMCRPLRYTNLGSDGPAARLCMLLMLSSDSPRKVDTKLSWPRRTMMKPAVRLHIMTVTPWVRNRVGISTRKRNSSKRNCRIMMIYCYFLTLMMDGAPVGYVDIDDEDENGDRSVSFVLEAMLEKDQCNATVMPR